MQLFQMEESAIGEEDNFDEQFPLFGKPQNLSAFEAWTLGLISF